MTPPVDQECAQASLDERWAAAGLDPEYRVTVVGEEDYGRFVRLRMTARLAATGSTFAIAERISWLDWRGHTSSRYVIDDMRERLLAQLSGGDVHAPIEDCIRIYRLEPRPEPPLSQAQRSHIAQVQAMAQERRRYEEVSRAERPRAAHLPITGNGATMEELGVIGLWRCSAAWCTATIPRQDAAARRAGWRWIDGLPYCPEHVGGGG